MKEEKEEEQWHEIETDDGNKNQTLPKKDTKETCCFHN